MKATRRARQVRLYYIIGLGVVLSAFGQGLMGIVDPIEHARLLEQVGQKFKAGQTNDAPLLRMDWYSGSGPHLTLHWCRVEASGVTSSGVSSISNGSSWGKLNATNMHAVAETMGRLTVNLGEAIPFERQVVICGVRSNTWFSTTYDRTNIPGPVMELYTIVAPHLKPH